jgi:hypothetical protein
MNIDEYVGVRSYLIKQIVVIACLPQFTKTRF